MNKNIEKELIELKKILTKKQRLSHMIEVINFDQETQAPFKGIEEHGKDIIELQAQIFKLTNSKKYKDLVVNLYESLNEIECKYDKRLITLLHDNYLRNKNITPAIQNKISSIYSEAYLSWINAKEKKDYSLFKPTLEKIVEATNLKLELSKLPTKGNKLNDLMEEYEGDMTTDLLDNFFNELKEAIVPLLKKIQSSDVKIRTDFTTRKVDKYKQIEFGKYLLDVIGYDLSRGALGFSEHPFTTSISQNDHRVTTHVYEDNFISNIYSVVHEGGHGIFGQNVSEKSYKHFVDGTRSLGEDESVSRFFENRIGRSKEFIHLIYPKFKEMFAPTFDDVSEEELYLAVNEVKPGLIRTEADELTYTLHIIIRYEIEKEIVNENISLEHLNELWNKKYEEYLGVKVDNDANGILQDIHWTGGFGYFPTYAIGNAYNAMYFNRMKNELNVKKLILENNIKEIVKWMKENVFDSATYLSPKEWIKSLTLRELDPTDFKEYLVEKYSEIYKL